MQQRNFGYFIKADVNGRWEYSVHFNVVVVDDDLYVEEVEETAQLHRTLKSGLGRRLEKGLDALAQGRESL